MHGSVLIDSGILYALFDTRDAWHERARDFLTSFPGDFLVPATTLGEVAYLLEERFSLHGIVELGEWLAQSRITVEGLRPQDLRRMTLLMSKYPAMGFIDASVVATAERLMIETLATTDRRHFSQVRPSHAGRFTLVPE